MQEREVAGARGRVDELDGVEDEGGREPGRHGRQRRNSDKEEEEEQRCKKRVSHFYYYIIGKEPWSSGYGRRLTTERL